MNSTRLAVIGFVVAVIVAVYAFISQGQAADKARLAAFEATLADEERITAVAMMQEAVGTQVQAEAGQATARADVAIVRTAQSEAEATAINALDQANEVATQSARIAAGSTAVSEALQATFAADTNILSTAQALGTAAMGTAQSKLDTQATAQADTANQLATATSQVDLADFARQSAEADRTSALEQLWTIGTRQADTRDELATAQAIISGVTPTPVPTNAPLATTTPQPESTTVTSAGGNGEVPPLTNRFESNDGLVRVQYPEGWFAREVDVNFISIVNDDTLFDRGNSPVESGQYEIDILVSTRNDLGIDSSSTPEEILLTFVEFFKTRDSAFQASDPISVTLGQYETSRVVGTDGSNDLTITVIDPGNDGVGLIFAYSAIGENDQFTEVLDAVLATLAFG